MTQSPAQKKYFWFTCFAAFCTLLLVLAGAFVTSTDSGMSVPDWPLSHSRINPYMEGGVLYEHGHRLLASFVGMLTVIAAVWASLIGHREEVRRLAWVGVFMVILQGILGGITVTYGLPTAVSAMHGCLGQIYFCLMVTLALKSSQWWISQKPVLEEGSFRQSRRVTIIAITFVFAQLVLGATMRHMGAGMVIPDFPKSLGYWVPPFSKTEVLVNFMHRANAVLVVLVLLYFGWVLVRSCRKVSVLSKIGVVVPGMVILQFLLGAVTVLSGRLPIPTSLHVLNGALILALLVVTLFITHLLYTGFQPESDSDENSALSAEETNDRESKEVFSWGGVSDWKQLGKTSLVGLSTFTAVAGYLATAEHWSWVTIGLLTVFVFSVGVGASILNHVYEVDTDALMKRTANRPLPTGRVSLSLAEIVGGLVAGLSILVIAFGVHPVSGLMAFAAVGSYVFVYTPMKRWSSWNTFVGAFPGAFPVLIGSVAGEGFVSAKGLLLFAILFLWQIPHFMAVAWLCREEYREAGLKMATVIDPSGRHAGLLAIAYGALLVPLAALPTMLQWSGLGYFFCAMTLSVAYFLVSVLWAWNPANKEAKRLLYASLVYLPLVYITMIAL